MLYDLTDLRPALVAYAPPFDDDDRLLSPDQVAELLGMSLYWVHHTFTRMVPPMKIGRERTSVGPDRRPSRWPAYEVKAWIAARDRERRVR